MSHSIAIPQHQPVGYIKGRVRNLLLSAIAGAIIGTLGYVNFAVGDRCRPRRICGAGRTGRTGDVVPCA
jgi:hypothetical protein